jgi:hypothetical protein
MPLFAAHFHLTLEAHSVTLANSSSIGAGHAHVTQQYQRSARLRYCVRVHQAGGECTGNQFEPRNFDVER